MSTAFLVFMSALMGILFSTTQTYEWLCNRLAGIVLWIICRWQTRRRP